MEGWDSLDLMSRVVTAKADEIFTHLILLRDDAIVLMSVEI